MFLNPAQFAASFFVLFDEQENRQKHLEIGRHFIYTVIIYNRLHKKVYKMATLKDVAKLANVDVSTVSRALNNTSYVHPDTKERIYAAAKELGYHPNVMAQALRQGKRHTIGVVVPRLHMAIFSEILQGIEQQAGELGYGTLICTTNDNPKTEKECLNRLRSFIFEIQTDALCMINLDFVADETRRQS